MSDLEVITLRTFPSLRLDPAALPHDPPNIISEVNVSDLTGRPATKIAVATNDPPFNESPREARVKANAQFAALCWSLFLLGWNDGCTGPLLPRIQSVYHVGFAVVSLIFVSGTLGYVCGAAANVFLTDRLGLGKVMVLGSVASAIAFALETSAPPFPVFVIAFAFHGFGGALQDAGANGYVASLSSKDAATKMGILHAVYGLGAFVSPLIATQFSQLHRWSFHYLTSLGIATINIAVLIVVLRFKTQEECLLEIGQVPSEPSAAQTSQGNKYKQIFRLSAVHYLALFLTVYVGIEFTIGGWIVTYLQDVRHGGPSSGYVSFGFFGGLTVGRIALLWLNKKVGERRVIFLYAFLAIGLELVIWLVPSLIGGAVAVSVIGVLLGPVFPIAMNHSGRILPPWLLTGAIGWIAGFGQASSAVLPFLTGLLASREGIKSLQPLLVAMMGVMTILWALVPGEPRRLD
ncbi:hypothetical protein CERSUDRAFT_116336 [Gelatoporia subvermispora B]|uniref:Major facilitator superfamily (MFS) profile domain-containing protein n=1 Tax=Ceriporiopsis subvermispora (strain B) TaxID=914234 RepID=M2QEX8_CERS8|nr:hypothetical protein CERSUDRAFT_116336 [Gelatoporia subvermispora B]